MRFFFRYVVIVFILSIVVFSLNAAELGAKDKVTLKTGEVYTGDILVRTSEIVIIQTVDGSRFQFQMSEVKEIEKNNGSVTGESGGYKISTIENSDNENLCGMIELSGGVAAAKHMFGSSPAGNVSISFGTKRMLNETLFLGAGVGYNSALLSTASELLNFVPVFVRLQTFNLKKKRTSPYLSLDAGYAFASGDAYKGGTYARFSGGVIHKLNYKTNIYSGVYAGVQGFSGVLTQTVNLSTLTYYGSSSILSFGIKAGLQF